MNSKVLLVGAPSDALRRSLSGEFWIQACPNAADALQLLPKTDCVVLICCMEDETRAVDFMRSATHARPSLPAILMVPDLWSGTFQTAAENSPVLLLPAQTNPEMVRLKA